MAVESLLVVGIAVTKMLLRARDLADTADTVSDAQEGWAALRRLTRRPAQRTRMAERIANQLQQRLSGVGELERRQDLIATAHDVADLIEGLAADDDALLTATADPGLLHRYVLEHGGARLRADTSAAAEPLFDELLSAALEEYANLAPNSPRYQRAALTRILGFVGLLPGIADDVTDIAAGVGRVEAQLGRLTPTGPIPWPLTPRQAPDPATGYQHRSAQALIPANGSVILSGSTGHGKTQIAIDTYHASSADLRLWVPASALHAVVEAYAEAATTLRLAPSDVPVEVRARAFLNWLANPAGRTWLLVLDDLPDPALLRAVTDQRAWWPPLTPSGLTLATTQSRLPELRASGRQLITIDTYTRAESLTYLRDRLHPITDGLGPDPLAEAADLAADLADHPLALAQAASVITHDGSTTTDYRIELATTTLAAALPESARADDYPHTVNTAHQLAVHRARRQFSDAPDVLLRYSLLDPAGAPDTLLNPAQRPTLRALHHLSLLTHQPQLGARAIRVHPLTARLTREHATSDGYDRAIRADADSLLDLWPDPETPTDTALVATLRSSTATLLDHDTRHSLWDHDRLASGHPLWFRYGRSLGDAGLARPALDHTARLGGLANTHLGPDHPDTLAARHSLARWQGEAGDPAGAAAAYQQLFADALRVLGPDDPNTFATRANLAHWQGRAGDPVGAATTYQELLADTIRVLGADHPHTLTTRGNLARSLGEAKDPAGAATAFEHLLDDMLRVLGPDHPHTLTTRGNFAHWLGQGGDAAGAVAEFEQLLHDRLRILGPDHPDTLGTRSNLARSRGEAGDPAGAATAFSQLLSDRLRVLGPDHPHTLNTRVSLAHWQGQAGDPAGAATAVGQVMNDLLRVLGPDHPSTFTARHTLAWWRGEAGDPAGAAAALELLLSDQLRVLGPNHPETLSTRSNLAGWHGEAGDPTGAAIALELLVNDQLRVLGPDHPHTLNTRQRIEYWCEQARRSVDD